MYRNILVPLDGTKRSEAILETAENEKADLIAMSTRGISRFYREVGESVAAGLLQKSDRPLLLVRNEADN